MSNKETSLMGLQRQHQLTLKDDDLTIVIMTYSYILRVVLVIIMEFHWFIGRIW